MRKKEEKIARYVVGRFDEESVCHVDAPNLNANIQRALGSNVSEVIKGEVPYILVWPAPIATGYLYRVARLLVMDTQIVDEEDERLVGGRGKLQGDQGKTGLFKRLWRLCTR